MSDNLSTMREQEANKLIWRNDADSENYEATTATGAYYWVKCIFDFSSDKNGKSLGYSIKYCPTDDDKDDRVHQGRCSDGRGGQGYCAAGLRSLLKRAKPT